MSEKVITETIGTFLWMAAGAIPARMAWNRGRGLAVWWVIGLFFWPILIFVVALIRPNEKVLAARAQQPDPEREWRDGFRGGLALLGLMTVAHLIQS